MSTVTYPNHGPGYMAATITVAGVAVAVVWLRMYSRIFVVRKTSWDDWTMFVASLFCIVNNSFGSAAFYYGLGRHVYDIPPDRLIAANKWLWAAQIPHVVSLLLIKVSVGLFLIGLIPQHNKLRWVIWVSLSAMFCAIFWAMIQFFIQCRPIQKVWNTTIPGTCLSTYTYENGAWAYLIMSILVDCTLFTIPVILFWNLQVKRRIKLALMGILSLGIFTCGCAIVEAVLFPLFFTAAPDKTWKDIPNVVLWATLQQCVGMICGSIPALKPLFRYFNEKGRKPNRRHFITPYTFNPGADNWDRKPIKPPITASTSIFSSKSHRPQDSASEEDIMMTADDGIHAVTKVEVHDDLTGSASGGPVEYSWNPV